MPQRANLALVGFMGAGKSSVGRVAASQLGLAFVDSDGIVEAKAGKTIAEIFDQDGEPAFRTLEREVVTTLLRERDLVIATGGGAFMDASAREILKVAAVVVYLDAPFDVLWERVSQATDRPLLSGETAKERARSLYIRRRKTYRCAHVQVDAAVPIDDVAQEVVRAFYANRGAGHRENRRPTGE